MHTEPAPVVGPSAGETFPPFLHGFALHAHIDWGLTSMLPPVVRHDGFHAYWNEESLTWTVSIPGVDHYVVYNCPCLMVKDLHAILDTNRFKQMVWCIGRTLAAIDRRLRPVMDQLQVQFEAIYSGHPGIECEDGVRNPEHLIEDPGGRLLASVH